MLEIPPCPACGTTLTEADADEARTAVTCSGCGAVYSLEIEDDPEEASAAEPTPAAPSPPPSPDPAPVAVRDEPEPSPFASPQGGLDRFLAPVPDVPDAGLPAGLTYEQSPGRLVLTWRWRSWRALGLVFFTILWDGFMVTWYGIALSIGEWTMAVFGLIHAAVGVGLAYLSAAMLVNRTRVVVEDGMLRVRHGPLPWMGSRDVPAGTLDQLYVVQRRETSSKGAVTIQYDLVARTREGMDLELVRSMPNAAHAQAMETRVEAVLGLVNRPMPNEFGA